MPPPNKSIITAAKNVRNYSTNILMFIYIYHWYSFYSSNQSEFWWKTISYINLINHWFFRGYYDQNICFAHKWKLFFWNLNMTVRKVLLKCQTLWVGSKNLKNQNIGDFPEREGFGIQKNRWRSDTVTFAGKFSIMCTCWLLIYKFF